MLLHQAIFYHLNHMTSLERTPRLPAEPLGPSPQTSSARQYSLKNSVAPQPFGVRFAAVGAGADHCSGQFALHEPKGDAVQAWLLGRSFSGGLYRFQNPKVHLFRVALCVLLGSTLFSRGMRTLSERTLDGACLRVLGHRLDRGGTCADTRAEADQGGRGGRTH